jgi:RNA polymerase sigma factor (sigma-70 family)
VISPGTEVCADRSADDGVIIARSVRHPETFAEIFDRYFADVHRYVERRLDTEAADEIASDTFLTAFRKRDSYRAESLSARPWLYGIATNLIGKHRRRRGSTLRAYQRLGAADSVESHAEDVVARVSAEQRRADLTRALAALSKGERDVLMLVALADFSHEEVAQALGIAYGTVASRLSRARAKLRPSLGVSTTGWNQE